MHPDLCVYRHERQRARQRRCVVPAKRPLAWLANRAEDRASHRDRPASVSQLRHRAAALVTPPNDALGGPYGQTRAMRRRQRVYQRALDGREIVERPLRRVLAGAPGHEVVRLALLAQKTQDGRQRRSSDSAVAYAGRVQPIFIELEAGGGEVRNPLMETRDQHPPDSRSVHFSDTLRPAARCRMRRSNSSPARWPSLMILRARSIPTESTAAARGSQTTAQ